jgi:V8-like Glu-specific endopeptidase
MAKRERPITSAQARKMKAIKATAPPPEPPSAPLHTTFVQVERGQAPAASVRVAPVSTRGRSATWRIDLDVGRLGTDVSVVLPQAERRVVTPALRRSVFLPVPPETLPPKWAAQTSVPAPGPRIPRTRVLRRGNEMEPLFIFPPDGRFVYKDTNYPWRCVGRVVSGGKIGSGVLIGPRHVLTASHVMNWSNLSVLFTADLFDNTNQGSSFATKVWHYDKLTNINTDNVEQDYVVAVLATALGSTLGWLGSREYYDDWDGEPFWSSIGYASDMGGQDRPVFQDDVILEEEDGGDMMAMTTTNGDFVPMQSGSAVFSWWSGEPYAIGVVSSQGQGMNWISGGEAMVDLVKTARNEDP